MKIYLVGGAVRDKILGKHPKDLDYVVVGSTPEKMIESGYKQVGSSFPVFLHPITGDEYALARTEKSVGDKYQDFDCYFGEDVTIEKDLERRDLTINSIAKDLMTGEYIDPFNGIADIKNKMLRATSNAFVEDPTRVFRLFRFMAELGEDWDVDSSLLGIVGRLLASGALDRVTPERIWAETFKAMRSEHPHRYFHMISHIYPVLSDMYLTEQKPVHHPEGNVGVHTELCMKAAVPYGPEVVFAAMCHDFGKPITHKSNGTFHGHEQVGLAAVEQFCTNMKVPKSFKKPAMLVTELHTKVHSCLGRGSNKGIKPKTIMGIFEYCNALDKPARFHQVLQACKADARGRGPVYENLEYPQENYLLECLLAVQKVNTKQISRVMLAEGKFGQAIGEAIRVAQIQAIREVQYERNN